MSDLKKLARRAFSVLSEIRKDLQQKEIESRLAQFSSRELRQVEGLLRNAERRTLQRLFRAAQSR
ncbi:MAG: hypothetical protein D6812_09855 [Deltaproteobacteria bacterium]|nr:MAG: hypothetical protein D6812_09855 [Deltaproteobacteria bacterium]